MSDLPQEPGWFVAIGGPSGAGKDTILRGARLRLSSNRDVSFPKRSITRTEGDESEDHNPMTERAFETAQAAGAFCVWWSAHGLRYGIPKSALDDIANGKIVVANVSRAVLDDIRARFSRVRVVQVTVDRAILAERLRKRGRETEDEIQSRLSRADDYSIKGPEVLTLDNSGDPETAITGLVAILERLTDGARDQSVGQE